MRRATLLAVLAAVPLLVGCSGADALRAQELLREASAAQQRLKSQSFTGRLSISGDGEEVVVTLRGGAYQRGPRAGDMYLEVDVPAAAGVPGGGGSLGVVRRGERVSLTFGGTTTTLEAPRTTRRVRSTAPAAFDFARYVTSVKVEDGSVVAGAAATKVTGVLETSALIESLAPFSALAEAAGRSLPELSSAVGDTRVVAYFSTRTHRLLAALVDVSIDVDGKSMRMRFDLGFTGFDKRVAIPPA